MKNQEKKTNVNFACPISIRDTYQRLYPYTLSRFLVKCIARALVDKNWFLDVYFYSGDKK